MKAHIEMYLFVLMVPPYIGFGSAIVVVERD